VDLIHKIVNIYNIYGYKTEVLAASIRHSQHIIQCAEAGADVITAPLDAIMGLLKHPLTDLGLQKFLEDYRKLNGV
jgi:transaldolase